MSVQSVDYNIKRLLLQRCGFYRSCKHTRWCDVIPSNQKEMVVDILILVAGIWLKNTVHACAVLEIAPVLWLLSCVGKSQLCFESAAAISRLWHLIEQSDTPSTGVPHKRVFVACVQSASSNFLVPTPNPLTTVLRISDSISDSSSLSTWSPDLSSMHKSLTNRQPYIYPITTVNWNSFSIP